jgi:hypothetical protein
MPTVEVIYWYIYSNQSTTNSLSSGSITNSQNPYLLDYGSSQAGLPSAQSAGVTNIRFTYRVRVAGVYSPYVNMTYQFEFVDGNVMAATILRTQIPKLCVYGTPQLNYSPILMGSALCKLGANSASSCMPIAYNNVGGSVFKFAASSTLTDALNLAISQYTISEDLGGTSGWCGTQVRYACAVGTFACGAPMGSYVWACAVMGNVADCFKSVDKESCFLSY